MDIKSAIAKLVSDCDQRQRLVLQTPNLFDNYFVTNSGGIVTEDEFKRINSLRYFSDGFDLVSGNLARL